MNRRHDQTPDAGAVSWALVDRDLARAKDRLAAAASEGEWRSVGVQCGDAIISLAHAVALPQLGSAATGLSFRTATEFLQAQVSRAKLHPKIEQFLRSALTLIDHLHEAGTPDRRSAALCLEATVACVNTVASTAGRVVSTQTVAQLIERYIEERGLLGESHLKTLQVIARSELGEKRASALQVQDIIDYFRARREAGEVSPSTITQYLSYLRGVLVMAREEWHLDVSTEPLEQAKRLMAKLNVTGRSKARTRRPTRDEIKQLLDYLVEQDKHPRSRIPMADIMEFGLWTGRRLGEICRLRWDQIDLQSHECRLGGQPVRLLNEAWAIIDRRLPPGGNFVFGANAHSASQRYRHAKTKLKIPDLTFQDLRREALVRLKGAGYSLPEIGAALGRKDLNSLQRDIEAALAHP